MDIIIETLRSLGLSGKYKGYYYLVEAIQIILQMDVQPFCVTKDIYPPIATRHRIKTDSVESGIRQMARYCWENSCVVLCEMAGYQLEEKPSNRAFVEILANYVRSRLAVM